MLNIAPSRTGVPPRRQVSSAANEISSADDIVRRRRWHVQNPARTAFVLALAACLFVGVLQGKKPFLYDSYSYWQLGDTFVRHGHWSLLNFQSPLRGYLLPLIYSGLADVATILNLSSSVVVQIFNAVLFALVGAVVVPRLVRSSGLNIAGASGADFC